MEFLTPIATHPIFSTNLCTDVYQYLFTPGPCCFEVSLQGLTKPCLSEYFLYLHLHTVRPFLLIKIRIVLCFRSHTYTPSRLSSKSVKKVKHLRLAGVLDKPTADRESGGASWVLVLEINCWVVSTSSASAFECPQICGHGTLAEIRWFLVALFRGD